MSSCPTGPASTTASSSNSRSPAEPELSGSAPLPGSRQGVSAGPWPLASTEREAAASTAAPVVVIACGALGAHIRDITARHGWLVELHCLPALLHNRPQQIAPQAERLAREALGRGQRVAVAYADCGTYGALDEVCSRLGLRRLPGLHCYDVLAGPQRLRAMFESEPGTYVLTDFLVRSFRRAVLTELGLDRYPDLWPDYFGHYRRLIWLAQDLEPGLHNQANRIAALFGLPLTVIKTGTARLEYQLAQLLNDSDDHAGIHLESTGVIFNGRIPVITAGADGEP